MVVPTLGAERMRSLRKPRGFAAGLLVAVALVLSACVAATPPSVERGIAGTEAGARPCRLARKAAGRPPEEIDATVLRAAFACAMERSLYAQSGHRLARKFRDWERRDRNPFFSPLHGERFVAVYANPAATRDNGRNPSGRIRTGATVATPSFRIAEDGTVEPGPLFLMEKMYRGFDTPGGNWRYTVISPEGDIVGVTGGQNGDSLDFCKDCSRESADEVYLALLRGEPPGPTRRAQKKLPVDPNAPDMTPLTPILDPEVPGGPLDPDIPPETVQSLAPLPTRSPKEGAPPVAEPTAPVVAVPIAPPASPGVDPDAPILDPNAPVIDPNAPIVDPGVPVIDPNAPVVDPNTPAADPNASPIEPLPEAPGTSPPTSDLPASTAVPDGSAPPIDPNAAVVDPGAPRLGRDAPAPETGPMPPDATPDLPDPDAPVLGPAPAQPASPIDIPDPDAPIVVPNAPDQTSTPAIPTDEPPALLLNPDAPITLQENLGVPVPRQP